MPERKKNTPLLIGRLTKIVWKMQFLIRYTGIDVFSKCLRAYTIYPLASLSSPWLPDGHTWSHTPPSNNSLNVRLSCCCFGQYCSCWSRQLHLASKAALPAPTATHLSTGLQPARPLHICSNLPPMFSFVFSSEMLKNTVFWMENVWCHSQREKLVAVTLRHSLQGDHWTCWSRRE